MRGYWCQLDSTNDVSTLKCNTQRKLRATRIDRLITIPREDRRTACLISWLTTRCFFLLHDRTETNCARSSLAWKWIT